MAAGLGYKEFTTGDVLTAADANGYLASQVVMVFASAAARTSAIASPQEGMFSYLKDTNSTEYYSGSAWTAVGGGGGGKVLQVVQGTTTTGVSNSTSTLADTTLTATITPSATTSKVLAIVSHPACAKSAASAGNVLQLVLLRGSTTISTPTDRGLSNFPGSIDNNAGFSWSYLDSPSTTSATTYKTQFANPNNAAQVIVQNNSGQSTIILMEIGA